MYSIRAFIRAFVVLFYFVIKMLFFDSHPDDEKCYWSINVESFLKQVAGGGWMVCLVKARHARRKDSGDV